METRFVAEFEGLQLRCVQDGGEISARIKLPSGGWMGLSFDGTDAGSIYSIQVATPADRELYDRLTRDSIEDIGDPGRPELRTFRRPRPEVAAAIRAAAPIQVPAPVPVAAPDPLAWSETLALLDLERTPMAPAAVLTRGRRRTCVECGSPVYGDHCTHCHEG